MLGGASSVKDMSDLIREVVTGKGKLCDSAERIRLTRGAMIELETLRIKNQD